MIEIAFSSSFKRSFKNRIQGRRDLEDKFWERVELFKTNPFANKLKTHKLSGKLKGLWSFSLEYDIRIVFFFTKDKPQRAVLIDIGTHDEVY